MLLHYFSRVDTTGFYASAEAPVTEGREEMIEANASADYELLRYAMDSNVGPFVRDVFSITDVQQYLRDNGIRYVPSMHALGRMLKNGSFGCEQRRIDIGGPKYRLFICRNKHIWMGAPAKMIVNYWQGDVDPLTL